MKFYWCKPYLWNRHNVADTSWAVKRRNTPNHNLTMHEDIWKERHLQQHICTFVQDFDYRGNKESTSMCVCCECESSSHLPGPEAMQSKGLVLINHGERSWAWQESRWLWILDLVRIAWEFMEMVDEGVCRSQMFSGSKGILAQCLPNS